jgi:hypothetical protein
MWRKITNGWVSVTPTGPATELNAQLKMLVVSVVVKATGPTLINRLLAIACSQIVDARLNHICPVLRLIQNALFSRN